MDQSSEFRTIQHELSAVIAALKTLEMHLADNCSSENNNLEAAALCTLTLEKLKKITAMFSKS